MGLTGAAEEKIHGFEDIAVDILQNGTQREKKTGKHNKESISGLWGTI